MDIKNNLLDLPATPEKLRRLARAGVLNVEALERALKIISHTPDTARWARFLDILLLVLGAGFTVSGVFFFFAFNWAGMHRFFKLGLLEAAVLLAVGLAFWRKLDRISGKIALGTAGLLVGALLAVYGQIYQTGADSYQLFLTWALLIAGWVLISKFTPLWFVWVLLFDLSLAFYWMQIVGEINGRLCSIAHSCSSHARHPGGIDRSAARFLAKQPTADWAGCCIPGVLPGRILSNILWNGRCW